MTPQEIMQALKIPEDLPPWDGEIREVQASVFGSRVRVLSVASGWALVQLCPRGLIVSVSQRALQQISLMY